MLKGNLYLRFRKEERLKMKKKKTCKLLFQKLGEEKIKPKGYRSWD